jgi:peptidoglycan/LPS O-acetylase OafA/YrhL
MLSVRPATGSDSPHDEWRLNNFDLIRLLAALQVVTIHSIVSLHWTGLLVGIVNSSLDRFPGVPIFFLISGCLVSKSYERSSSLREYYRNRCLRIFPGLWVCLVASLAVIAICGVERLGAVSTPRWLTWWTIEMSGLWPSYPQFLKPLGTGTLNGSLWTIPVELQFYLLLPVLYALLPRRRAYANVLLLALLAVSYLAQLKFDIPEFTAETRWYGQVLSSLLPVLWMFLVGVLVQRNWSSVRPWLIGRAHWWVLGYLLLAASGALLHIPVLSFNPSPVYLVALAGVVFSCAMSARGLAARLLRGQDISYGIYIYHMLVLNVLVQFRVPASSGSIAAVLATTLLLAALSWILIERPFLARKRYGVRLTPLYVSLHPA